MASDRKFYDELETRDPEVRLKEQLLELSAQIAHAKENTSYFGHTLKDIVPSDISSLEALAGLPVTRKSDLITKQKEEFPLGGMNAEPMSKFAHIFMSPGPIFEPGGGTADFFRMGRAMWAAGFRPGDLVYNTLILVV